MKILWLYQFKWDYQFDHHLTVDFAEILSKTPGVELRAYGPGMRNAYPYLTFMEYDPKLTLASLHSMFPFDIVMIETKSRCFFYYNPKINKADGCWLPPDMATWKRTPKIVSEQDYHYEIDDSWYKSMGIDLILQRHYSQSLRQQSVPMKWLPFSVDTKSFNPYGDYGNHKGHRLPLFPNDKRKKKIAIVGNDADQVYIYRRTAKDILIQANLCANYAGARKIDGEYIQVLREYLGYISCGSTCEITAGKNFEIMASGGVLFTNRFVGIDLVFPPNTYCAYKNDCSDVVQQANRVVYEPAYTKELLANAANCIQTRHSHEVRIQELLAILRKAR